MQEPWLRPLHIDLHQIPPTHMALAKERLRHNPELPFDPSSLEHLSSDQGYFDLSNASNIGFSSSLQHERSTSANHWAYSSPPSSSSLLSFDQGDRFANSNYSTVAQDHEECTALWIDTMDRDVNCLGMASGYGGGGEGFSQKRSYTRGDLLPSKKHCGNDGKGKARPSPSKDPQSIAAKNRRERISERLRTLQELVPNGTKVDLVTMLEKAISYVKFLQLQVKVLATDEFWPAQGGKAPEVSQVKEAIDAILSSHRERNSSNISKH